MASLKLNLYIINIPSNNQDRVNVPIREMPNMRMPDRAHLSIVPANEDHQESRE